MSIPFGFGPGSGEPSGSGDPAPFFRELEKLLSWQGGPVNWELAGQLAQRAVADGDPVVTGVEQTEIEEALRLADVWLDGATVLPSGITRIEAWSRRRWLEATLPAWRQLCDPVAARISEAMSAQLTGGLQALSGEGDVPPELLAALPQGMSAADLGAAAGPLMGMVTQIGGLMFGAQVGQALGGLAGGVASSTEVGLPLGPAGIAALLPTGVRGIGAGLEQPLAEVRLHLALREAAHQRLFAHAPWLRAHLFGLVEDFARGISVDSEAIGRALSEVDPMNPESMQRALGSGVFSPTTTPAQQAALARLETALALVEGWVDEVVARAAAGRLPSEDALREALRRRRASGGPAEQAFGALVGLELRPRRLREAAALWAELLERRGMEGRDAVWGTPDLLPSGADLDDPSDFFGDRTREGASADGGDPAGGEWADLDDPIAAIEALGDTGPHEGDTGPDADPGTDPA